MANEIQFTAALNVVKNGVTTPGSASGYADMTGSEQLAATQSVGITYEALALGDISGAPGYLFVKNMDATNYVEIALDTAFTYKFAKLLPGQAALFPPTTATLYVKANTAPCLINVVACEA